MVVCFELHVAYRHLWLFDRFFCYQVHQIVSHLFVLYLFLARNKHFVNLGVVRELLLEAGAWQDVRCVCSTTWTRSEVICII
jgi:hypothetical protein